MASADVTGWSAPPRECDISVSGTLDIQTAREVISDGQALLERLDSIYRETPFADGFDRYWPPTVCLDSPGGSYAAGIALAEFFAGRFATRIEEDAECFSSCALAFMAGTRTHPDNILSHRWFEEERWPSRPDRTLHPNATVGFHAPYVRDQQVPEGMNVQDVVAEVNFVSSFLFAQAEAINFPSPLIGEMLRRGPSEMYLVDEVGQLNAWQISLESSIHPPLSDSLLRRACYLVWNDHSYSEGGYGRLRETDTGLGGETEFQTFSSGWLGDPSFGRLDSGEPVIFRENVGYEASLYCALVDRNDDYLLIVGSGGQILRSEALDGWQLLPPETSISEVNQN